jgi:AraC-like DNA-binding protein
MKDMLNLFLVYVLSCGSSFLLSVLLILNFTKVNRAANVMLGISALLVSQVFLQLAIEHTATSGSHTDLIPWLEIGRWAIFPSFFLAIRRYINPSYNRLYDLVHYIPTAFLIVLLFQHLTFPPLFVWIIRYFFYMQLLGYGISSLRLLIRFLAQHFSFSSYLTAPLYLVLIIYFAFHALSQRAIYPVEDQNVQELRDALQVQATKDKERLTDEQLVFFTERLLFLIQNERPYLDPQVNLPSLANKIGLSVHELSYVLNAGVGKNFYQFINEYRIAEAKNLLQECGQSNYDMQEIGIRAGFNSKTTFYTAFRKSIGLTPKQYMEQVTSQA